MLKKSRAFVAGHQEVVRYVIVGSSVYVIEIACIYMFQRLTNNGILAVAGSFWVGLVASFILQKSITFKDKRIQKGVVASQFLATASLVVFNFMFTVGFVKLFGGFGPVYIVRTVALGLTTIWNFYLYRTKIFKQPLFD